tara:strand:+ start:806 stop:1120 length:315 start_codon:yes stop_codon:yes gene_type:complete
MALKFDGKCLKDSSKPGKTLCTVRGNKICEGIGYAKVLANVRGDNIYERTSLAKVLANVRGDKIYEGTSMAAHKVLIKTSDAARKIGATSRGPLTAAIWYLFCR